MTAGPAVEPADRFVAERLLATVREDVGRADTKASILLSGAVAAPALLIGGRWPAAGGGTAATALLSAGALLWLLGAAALVRTILPRTGTGRAVGDLTYFGDLLAAENPDLLVARVASAGRDPVRWLLVQSVDVSTILAAKYRWIRRGVACMVPGALLAVAGLLLRR
ncbi:Pycsar system effector family protein [Streptacidiphilus sp. N1-10]|uniref:Pycsar system effector family protein n=1 Tax=Streptacidiphilus jeojiensis TaxID=3229225 RepID=A0ABV6XU31_9ACTN